MRIYLELFESPPEGSGEEADFIRIDVTDWGKEDVDTAIQLIKEHAQIYDHYVLQIHYCRHEEGEPCNTTIIDSK
jgi:hypothetical protein